MYTVSDKPHYCIIITSLFKFFFFPFTNSISSLSSAPLLFHFQVFLSSLFLFSFYSLPNSLTFITSQFHHFSFIFKSSFILFFHFHCIYCPSLFFFICLCSVSSPNPFFFYFHFIYFQTIIYHVSSSFFLVSTKSGVQSTGLSLIYH